MCSPLGSSAIGHTRIIQQGFECKPMKLRFFHRDVKFGLRPAISPPAWAGLKAVAKDVLQRWE